MPLTNTNREARRTARPVLRDLRFAGTVAAGLVAGVLGIGALSAPLLGWSEWPDGLTPGGEEVVRLQEPGERGLGGGDRTSNRRGGGGGGGEAAPGVPVGGAAPGAGDAVVVTLPTGGGLGTGPAAGGSERRAQRIGSGRQDARNGDDFGGSGFAPANTADTDGDKMPDVWEARYGLDPLSADDAGADNDGDGVPNAAEFWTRSLPGSPDSDNNGVKDGDEDFDADGLRNAVEVKTGSNAAAPDSNGDGQPDSQDDHDGDGVSSGDEQQRGTDPTVTDPPPPTEPPTEPEPGDTPPDSPPTEEPPPVATEPDPVDVEEPTDDDEIGRAHV
jgi:hypothetical protein